MQWALPVEFHLSSATPATTARVEPDHPVLFMPFPSLDNAIRTSVPSHNSIDLQLILVAVKDCIVEEE